MTEEDGFDLNDAQTPQQAFHLELDLYDNGEYSDLLFIPCNDVFIVVSNNEHFTTMVRKGKGMDAWEQRDGQIEDEIFEKLVIALGRYIGHQEEKRREYTGTVGFERNMEAKHFWIYYYPNIP